MVVDSQMKQSPDLSLHFSNINTINDNFETLKLMHLLMYVVRLNICLLLTLHWEKCINSQYFVYLFFKHNKQILILCELKCPCSSLQGQILRRDLLLIFSLRNTIKNTPELHRDFFL